MVRIVVRGRNARPGRGPGSEDEVAIAVGSPDATVADLARSLGLPLERGALRIDGRRAEADLALIETALCEGAAVEPEPACAGPVEAGSGWVLSVAGGLDAGRVISLPAGDLLVGRDPQAEVALVGRDVAFRHALVRVGPRGVDICDLGSPAGVSRNGRRLVGVTALGDGDSVTVGDVAVVLRRAGGERPPSGADPLRHAGPDGRVLYNRPPRAPAAPAAGPLPAPSPADVPTPRALPVASLVVPLAVAALLVTVTGNWLFATITVVAPLSALCGWWWARRASGRAASSERARAEWDLARFADELAGRCRTEAARLAQLLPDPAEVAATATGPTSRLWERRPHHPDTLRLRVGRAEWPWCPPLEPSAALTRPDLAEAITASGRLLDAAVDVGLGDGGVLGIAGPRAAAAAVARCLVVQAAVHHGPADLTIVVAAPDAVVHGDLIHHDTRHPVPLGRRDTVPLHWAHWLPHTADPDGSGARLVATSAESSDALLAGLVERAAATAPSVPEPASPTRPSGRPVLLAVIGDSTLLRGRNAPARAVLRGAAGPVAGIVVADRPDQLPATCTAVLELDRGGHLGRLVDLRSGAVVSDVRVDGMTESTARRLARALARFEDPDQASGNRLPDRVGVSELLAGSDEGPAGVSEPALGAGTLRRRWTRADGAEGLAVPLGVGAEGPVTVDLVRDGPHALVVGTTGAGKSELLRTWVAAMAATAGPTAVNFVLVDYKGGSAFDALARLPHTVGVVTDLDAELGERALRCLGAELRHREAVLRRAGADSLDAYRRRRPPGAEPLARLVVVVDEFATLAAELPEFLRSLVGIAQRGRSLGVHLVLATQRPSGSLDDDIRSNTNLRVALRVQHAADSVEVVGVAAAAELPRGRPGRAIVRFGRGELVSMQTAVVDVDTAGADPRVPVAARPLEAPEGPRSWRSGPRSQPDAAALAALVDAAADAAAALGLPTPRCPWPPPLPTRLGHDSLDQLPGALPPPLCGPRSSGGGGVGMVPLWAVDDPEQQRVVAGGWEPDRGHLVVFGAPGSGTTTTLASVAAALARQLSPDDCHLYVVHTGGPLGALADLPHTGAVVAVAEEERLRRLLRMVRADIDRRRFLDPTDVAGLPQVVLLLDGIRAVTAALDPHPPGEGAEEVGRLLLDGPAVGVCAVVVAEHVTALRPSVMATVTQKLILRPADLTELRYHGIRGPMPAVPGRGYDGGSGLSVQVADPGELAATVAAESTRWRPARRPAPGVARLPHVLPARALAPARRSPGMLRIPLGVGTGLAEPVDLVVPDGDHVLVAGPPRSGRSAALALLATAVRAGDPRSRVLAVASSRSPLARLGAATVVAPSDLEGAEAVVGMEDGRPLVVLVDDADTVADEGGVLSRLAGAGALVVAAGRADALRQQFGHWTRLVRACRRGVLLVPDTDLDGDLLGVRIPRRPHAPMTAGRGYLVADGTVEGVQLAYATDDA